MHTHLPVGRVYFHDDGHQHVWEDDNVLGDNNQRCSCCSFWRCLAIRRGGQRCNNLEHKLTGFCYEHQWRLTEGKLKEEISN